VNKILVILLFCFYSAAQGQQQLLPMEWWLNLRYQAELNKLDNPALTSFKPYLQSDTGLHTTDKIFKDTNVFYYDFTYKLFADHLINIKDENSKIHVDPLLIYYGGKDFRDTSRYLHSQNSRGFIVRGDLGDKISFSTSFLETQAYFPNYIDTFAFERKVIPGMIRWKEFIPKTGKYGYDYGVAAGWINVKPTEWLQIQFGHDKNFVGDGYRSLLLSDNAFNYPFLRTSYTFLNGKLRYTSVYAWMQTLERMPAKTTPEALFIQKGGTFHYLQLMLGKRIELGLFEGTTFKRFELPEGTTPPNIGQYFPLMGFNTAKEGFDAENNVLLGLNLSIKIVDGIRAYGQLALDDPATNRLGYQAGIQLAEPLNVKGLFLTAEFNAVNPFTYSHENKRYAYTHNNQELAHPLGASFNEWAITCMYETRRMRFTNRTVLATKGIWDSKGQGANPTINENRDVDGKEKMLHRLSFINPEINLKLNVKTNASIFTGVLARYYDNSSFTDETFYFYFGIRTSLYNQYLDF
jgi:hypothetical protein